MSYNRLDDDYYDQMDPRRPAPGRTPSPGHALQHGYQYDEQAYGQQQLDIPMGPTPGRYGTPADSLHIQQAHSIENLGSPFDDGRGYHQDSYSVDPQAHHDAYYNQGYDPHAGEEGYAGVGVDDQRPMLSHPESLEPYQDNPQPTPSPAPIRRWKTVKRVELYRGNLVLDCPVPPKLLKQLPHGERDEFTHMRYSAATCDPNDFAANDFTLRQRLFSKPRQTELFIVVTMYNEDEILFARTMIGVLKNVEYMCNRTSSKTWGKDAWKKIIVCVVSDGRNKINPRTRALLAGMGVYQEGIAKDNVNGKPVTAHIYEYTTQVGMRIKDDAVQLIPKSQPVQILFCLKEKNAKKINSHRWFFNAFGPVLDPNICVLIDAGTKPGNNSIYHLWKAFDLEPMCGGACGEIKAMLGTAGRHLLNPLVATQNFEYKMSNILDKPLESAFGFISVLPGAFSAYRYVALQNDKTGQGPLEKYFKGETLHGGGEAGVFESNMYLAEDRILCFELVTKRKCSWILQYVKSATGETDVPDGISELILQRRRWLNGSFFAAIYAIAHFYQFFRSDHSFIRKFMFFIEFIFNTINMIFAWFAIGNFFLVFKILVDALGSDNLLGTAGTILSIVFQWLYGVCLMTCFVISMGNRPAGWLSRRIYATMAWFWAIIMCYLMFAAIYIAVIAIKTDLESSDGITFQDILTNKIFYTLIISLMSTYGLWLVASLLMFDPWHMVTSLIQYMLLTPTFVNILNVYAFCNTHDVSWGTKGDDKAEKLGGASTKDGAVKVDLPDESDLNAQYERELAVFRVKAAEEVHTMTAEQKQEDYYSGVRSIIVLLWMLMNFGLIAAVLATAGVDKLDTAADEDEQRQQRADIYLAVVLWSVAGLSAFKFIGAMWFLVVRLFRGV